jgi:hypothetical protein
VVKVDENAVHGVATPPSWRITDNCCASEPAQLMVHWRWAPAAARDTMNLPENR